MARISNFILHIGVVSPNGAALALLDTGVYADVTRHGVNFMELVGE